MNKTIIALIFLLLLVGCDEIPQQKTPEQQLLYELEHCDSKYSTSNYANTEMNSQYCNKLLGMIKELMDKNCMKADPAMIQKYEAQTKNTTLATKNVADAIVGEI